MKIVWPIIIIAASLSQGYSGQLADTQKDYNDYDAEIDLYENTLYTITLKAGGVLTWSYRQVNSKYNNVQIVYGAALADYVKQFYNDTLWRLIESEVYGYAVFVNHAVPNAVLTWAGRSPSGRYVVLHMDSAKNPDYLPGGIFRDDCLWKIVPEKGAKGTYLIYNKRFPGNGIVTFSSEFVEDGKKFVQFYDTGSPEDYYQHDSNYLWQFEVAKASP